MVKSDQLDRYTGTSSYYGTISTNSTLKNCIVVPGLKQTLPIAVEI